MQRDLFLLEGLELIPDIDFEHSDHSSMFQINIECSRSFKPF